VVNDDLLNEYFDLNAAPVVQGIKLPQAIYPTSI
jgi:hypothetical protein